MLGPYDHDCLVFPFNDKLARLYVLRGTTVTPGSALCRYQCGEIFANKGTRIGCNVNSVSHPPSQVDPSSTLQKKNLQQLTR